jgi:DNA-directed RNA polymerase subunit RPC12/RpoP
MSKEAYTPPTVNREQYSPPTAGGPGAGQSFAAVAPRPPAAISYLCAGTRHRVLAFAGLCCMSLRPGLMGCLGRRLYLARRLTLDCGASNSIGQKEQIRCRECGHRVMYKKRTRRMGILSYKGDTDDSPIRGEIVCWREGYDTAHGIGLGYAFIQIVGNPGCLNYVSLYCCDCDQ